MGWTYGLGERVCELEDRADVQSVGELSSVRMCLVMVVGCKRR